MTEEDNNKSNDEVALDPLKPESVYRGVPGVGPAEKSRGPGQRPTDEPSKDPSKDDQTGE